MMTFKSSSTKLRHVNQDGKIMATRYIRRLRLSVAAIAVIAAMTASVETATASSTGWTSLAPTLSYHVSGAAVAGKDGKVYVFGGRIPNSLGTRSAVEAYTPGSNSWAAVAPMPTARYALAAVRGPNGKIYVLGGRGQGGVRRKNEVYDPKTNTWTTKARMPIGGSGIAAAAGADGKIYVFGGYRKNFGPNGHGLLNAVQIYDPTTNTWTVNHSMPAELIGSAAARGPNGKIYLMGGYPLELTQSTARVWSYEPSTTVWNQVASMSVARTDFGAVAIPSGKIYAIAGQNVDSALKSVEAYSVASDTWSSAPSLPSARYGLSVATSGGTIYEVGGDDEGGAASKSVMSYTP
jgi:N-acetylneuraminic acid mutarotase